MFLSAKQKRVMMLPKIPKYNVGDKLVRVGKNIIGIKIGDVVEVSKIINNDTTGGTYYLTLKNGKSHPYDKHFVEDPERYTLNTITDWQAEFEKS